MAKSTISGTVVSGVSLSSSIYVNPVTITSGARVSNGGNAVSAASNWTIQNCGYVASANGFGIALSAGGAVTNAASCLINGYGGISIKGASGTVVNAGVILAVGDSGISLEGGGSVTNAAGGSIYSALYSGLYGGAFTTVDNQGSLSGLRFGVALRDGGSVTNAAGASIYGGDKAVYLTGRALGTVLNSGSINGYNSGVYLFDLGGSVTNNAGGLISGTEKDGVISLGPATVANAGVIAGAIDAVYFDGVGANRLIVDAGAVFDGAVKAIAGGANVIELASSTNAGRLSGLGSEYLGFRTVTIDSGAAWTVAGAKGGFAGVAIGGFNSKDALDITDVAFAAGEKASANASGVLTVTNAGGTTLATVALSGNLSAIKFAVAPDGTGGIEITEGGAFIQRSEITGTYANGIALTAAGYTDPVTLTGTGRITAAAGANALFASTPWEVLNSGAVAASGGFGVDLAAGGSLTNAGSIASATGGAVFLGAGGMVTNSAGGRIAGATDGIEIIGGGTVDNAGTISGATAIAFTSSSAHRLIADDGAVFNGAVTAAGSANTLEMTRTALGTHPAIAGLGTKFTGFQTLQFDKGAAWVVSGSFAGLQTIAGIHPGDVLDLTSITYTAGETVDVSSSSRLEIRTSAGTVVWSALLLNLRYRANKYGKFTFNVAQDATGGSVVTVARNIVPALATVADGLTDQVARFSEAVAANFAIPASSGGFAVAVHPSDAPHLGMLASATH